MATVRQAFKPEFLNRLDEVVIFDPLSKDELRTSSTSRSASWPPACAIAGSPSGDGRRPAWLAEQGYDPRHTVPAVAPVGAEEIGDRLARAVLSGDVRDGAGSPSTSTGLQEHSPAAVPTLASGDVVGMPSAPDAGRVTSALSGEVVGMPTSHAVLRRPVTRSLRSWDAYAAGLSTLPPHAVRVGAMLPPPPSPFSGLALVAGCSSTEHTPERPGEALAAAPPRSQATSVPPRAGDGGPLRRTG